MKYLFPFASVPKDARIILYGASDVGYDYYRQIMNSGYVDLVAWLDRNYEMYRMLDLPVGSPEEINLLDYDYVVIAVLEEASFKSIKSYLTKAGTPDDIIIWNESALVGYDIARSFRNIDLLKEAKNAVEMNPVCLIDEDRLDVVVRYLYADEILKGIVAGQAEKMYEKMFLRLNDAIEPTDHFLFRYFSDYDNKRGIDEFKRSFSELISSIRGNGFRRECFIPLDRNGRMMNGSHRCAAALAVGSKVWVRKYPVSGVKILDHHFAEDWFKENVFRDDELKMITECYKSLKN